MDSLSPTGVFLIFLVGFVVVVAIMAPKKKKLDQAWQKAAKRLNLEFSPGGLFDYPDIKGELHGFQIAVDKYSESVGRKDSACTRYIVRYPKLGLGLRLSRQSFFTGIAKLVGSQDIEVGERFFDDDVVVKGDPALVDKIVDYLNHARRMRIHRLLMSYEDAVVADAETIIITDGVEKLPYRIVSVIQDLVRVAHCLVSDREEDLLLEQAMQARLNGRIAEALDMLEQKYATPQGGTAAQKTSLATEAKFGEHASSPPIAEEDQQDNLPVEEQLLKGELLYLGEEREKSRDIFHQALEERPDDQEIRHWVEQVDRTRSGALPDSSAGETLSAGTPLEGMDTPHDTQSLDVGSVCATLFDPGHFSSDANRIFNERFAGKNVRWTGTLRSVETFSYDFVFGADPGVKASFEVYELSAALYGGRLVLAFVKFPEELAEDLRSKVGTSLSFDGTLSKIDGLMRNFFIDNGRNVCVR